MTMTQNRTPGCAAAHRIRPDQSSARSRLSRTSFSVEPGRIPPSAPTEPARRRPCGCCSPHPGEQRDDDRRPGLPRPRQRSRRWGQPRGDRPPPPVRRDHLRVLAAAAGIDDGRADELLSSPDLRREPAGRRIQHGMRQRLGLAAALLGDPTSSSSTNPRTASTRRASVGCAASCVT